MMNPNHLLEILLESKMEFIVIGAFAGVLHGASTVTKDIDLCMDLSEEQILQLRRILQPLQPKHRGHPKHLSFLDHPSDLRGVKNLYLQTTLGPLDILSEVAGMGGYQQVKQNSVQISLFGYACRVMSLEGVIASKKALAREKDRGAIRELEAIVLRQRLSRE